MEHEAEPGVRVVITGGPGARADFLEGLKRELSFLEGLDRELTLLEGLELELTFLKSLERELTILEGQRQGKMLPGPWVHDRGHILFSEVYFVSCHWEHALVFSLVRIYLHGLKGCGKSRSVRNQIGG